MYDLRAFKTFIDQAKPFKSDRLAAAGYSYVY